MDADTCCPHSLGAATAVGSIEVAAHHFSGSEEEARLPEKFILPPHDTRKQILAYALQESSGEELHMLLTLKAMSWKLHLDKREALLGRHPMEEVPSEDVATGGNLRCMYCSPKIF